MKSTRRRSHNRVQPLLDAAAKLFTVKGYRETTMRDIAAEAGMQAGSVYYHFKSKADLLLAVYTLAVDSLEAQLESALSNVDDPWQRLEVAVVAHLETILDHNDYSSVMIGVTPDKAEDIRPALIALRDRYESYFEAIIARLPLAKRTDRRLLRLMLLGALNSTKSWYKEDEKSARAVGIAYVRFLRNSIEA
ncbi:MAG: TetR/AcrR family transcriptional regulator [Pseudomonadota bacterium]